ncbi:hypothetical protein C1645_879225 [Glomus cerebriforme]|uniref:Uncharacterized protein n=1 Tax=Glomus cerebriforme TaxID=658196 RepID=A0A397SNC5_9GLOM|nr:hypothetical protein C1645_879225 [Glomus cerebriforme]
MIERKKELYSKICAASGISFVAGGASDKTTRLTENKFSSSLAIILAKDKEVVAVMLKVSVNGCNVYIAKNDKWLEDDVIYIGRIENCLKTLSETAPISLKVAAKNDVVMDLSSEVMMYCTTKLESRFNKLKADIKHGQHKYIKSFIEYASIDIKNMDKIDIYDLSITCCRYYKNQGEQFKNLEDPATPRYLKKFLGHVKKVGSYYGSLNRIISYACNAKYKILFSHLEVILLEPTMTEQSIISWENVIKKFITDHKEYENFKEACLSNNKKKDNLRNVYGRNMQLDSTDIKQTVKLHAEMNILINVLINKEDKSRAFIAVSKKCCYLCELYIRFARTKGYVIDISGTHRKIYHLWKFPDANNAIFYDESLSYMIKNLNRIIRDETKNFTEEMASSDREAETCQDIEDKDLFEYEDNLNEEEENELVMLGLTLLLEIKYLE